MSYLDKDGFKRLHSWIKDKLSQKRDASSIVDIAHGGTGASDVQSAIQNLGLIRMEYTPANPNVPVKTHINVNAHYCGRTMLVLYSLQTSNADNTRGEIGMLRLGYDENHFTYYTIADPMNANLGDHIRSMMSTDSDGTLILTNNAYIGGERFVFIG